MENVNTLNKRQNSSNEAAPIQGLQDAKSLHVYR